MTGRSNLLRVAVAALGALAGVSPAPPARADAAADARAAAVEARRLVGLMDGTAEHVRGALRRARAQNAKRAVACLDEALSRVDSALRAARDEARLTNEAARAGDAGGAHAHALRVARFREAARAAAGAGDACAVAPELVPVGEGTSVRVIVDPSVAPGAPRTGR